MKSVANVISVARIVLSLTLFFFQPLSPVFLAVYLVIGASDILDGTIARKTGTTSKIGEKLDSIADLVLDTVIIVILYPVVNPKSDVLICIAVIAIIRLASVAVVYGKYKTFGMVHTLGNKCAGLLLFLFPILYAAFSSDILIYILCAVAALSALEEMVIDLFSKEWQANKKSIFIK